MEFSIVECTPLCKCFQFFLQITTSSGGDKNGVVKNDCITFPFYVTISNSILNWTTFVKEIFDLMLSSESDKMTGLWPNDS